MVECAPVFGSGMRSRLLSLGAYAVRWQDKMSLAEAQAEGVEAGRLQSHTVMPSAGTRRKPRSLAAGLLPMCFLPCRAEKAVGKARCQLAMLGSEEGHGPCLANPWLMGRGQPGCSQHTRSPNQNHIQLAKSLSQADSSHQAD